MHLISLHFLFFSASFCGAYFLLRQQAQKMLLLAASYGFVSYASAWMAALLAGSTVTNYLLSREISESDRNKKVLLTIAVLFNVAVLAAFKYFNFFSQTLASAIGVIGVHYAPYTMSIVVPLGLSFYTFQAISYQVDVSRNQVQVPSWLDFAIFLSFWPKFIAGPIIRSQWFLPQLNTRKVFRWPNLFLGLEMIAYGLFLKVVLSDNLLPLIDRVFANPDSYDGANALMAAFFFTFQIYGDFAGYSLIVIGIARILGYSVPRNFRRPNLAQSFSDFWSRWHISLSSWLEDYVFRSLVPRSGAQSGQTWSSVAELYASVLRREVKRSDSFEALAGDSLSYVGVAIGLEALLGELPPAWERLCIDELERLRLVRKEAVA